MSIFVDQVRSNFFPCIIRLFEFLDTKCKSSFWVFWFFEVSILCSFAVELIGNCDFHFPEDLREFLELTLSLGSVKRGDNRS